MTQLLKELSELEVEALTVVDTPFPQSDSTLETLTTSQHGVATVLTGTHLLPANIICCCCRPLPSTTCCNHPNPGCSNPTCEPDLRA
jgi:hypothetical protein